jgi:hypothetical protein
LVTQTDLANHEGRPGSLTGSNVYRSANWSQSNGRGEEKNVLRWNGSTVKRTEGEVGSGQVDSKAKAEARSEKLMEVAVWIQQVSQTRSEPDRQNTRGKGTKK